MPDGATKPRRLVSRPNAPYVISHDPRVRARIGGRLAGEAATADEVLRDVSALAFSPWGEPRVRIILNRKGEAVDAAFDPRPKVESRSRTAVGHVEANIGGCQRRAGRPSGRPVAFAIASSMPRYAATIRRTWTAAKARPVRVRTPCASRRPATARSERPAAPGPSLADSGLLGVLRLQAAILCEPAGFV